MKSDAAGFPHQTRWKCGGESLVEEASERTARKKGWWAVIMLPAACYRWVTVLHENYKHPVGAELWFRLCLTSASLWWSAGRNFPVGAPGNLFYVIYQFVHWQLHLIYWEEQMDLCLCSGSVWALTASQALSAPPAWSRVQYMLPLGLRRCYTDIYWWCSHGGKVAFFPSNYKI